jgi:hypothetical protein
MGWNRSRGCHSSDLDFGQAGALDLVVFPGENHPFPGGDVGTVPPLVPNRTRVAAGVMGLAVKGPGGQGQQPNQNTDQEWSFNPFHVTGTLSTTPDHLVR